ncbi:MAG TPA: P-loop NTPase [Blastocatellia bacterium]|nr:P-loop NTPase [Blastocatellia bacterium]
MALTEIVVGILSPSAETREMLSIQVSATGLATVEVEAEQYCASYGDRWARRFAEVRPNIIIVDMEDVQQALQTLHVLHATLPETWLFVSSAANDSQLIIETMRAGAREFFPKPIPPRTLAQAIGRYISEKQLRQKNVGKIYCITSGKGGVGATTVSINLATSLAPAPDTQVALIDLSGPIGDTAAQLSIKPQFTISDVLASASRLDPVLLESFMSRAHGVAVLPGPKEFQPRQEGEADALAKALEVVARTYTHTFIDLSSFADKEYLRMIGGMAANVVVVSTPELPSLWRTERLLRFLRAMGLNDKLRLVINRSRKKDEISDSEIEQVLKHQIYWKLPNSYYGTIEAINSGSPVASANHSDLAHSYRDLAYKLAEITIPEKRRGLFRFK